ncbi:hypothetical protein [Streptomyces doebereineriae]|uniref:Uncharacterized protein n=1 Tax=Streptomyces doebereineriae TaxID=3075528 RepID=A0ABU2VHM0_9ACTN|nr:hypothetical protein [Streptomyces sp. DSM 41640]MDT0484798.1 hypothetical protein [Streptomyces sp. DSM 41640]
MDATQFSIAFFATLLTGEAVIFALTFSAASSWPSLRAIDGHIAFREWVLIGWFAALFTGCGLLGDSAVSATYGALLFLLANIFGVFSFVRLFGLASIGGRNQLLRRTLAEALTAQTVGAGRGPLSYGLEHDPIVNSYLGTVSQATTGNDPTAIRHLVDQLVGAEVPPEAIDNTIIVHLDVLHRLVRATLAGGVDPIQVVSCAHALIDSVIGHCRRLSDPAPPLGALSRYLAWLANTALLMSVRGVASSRAARELAALTTDARLKILRCVDPDPKSAANQDELGSILTGPLQVLLWTGDFTEFHGAHQASALYGTYEILTGTKFMGNYWDGASILTQLRQSLYGGEGRVSTPEADAARRAFGSVEAYDHFWALVSVTALATLRDARLPHPPELVRPEFTPNHQLLGAYLRTFATHRYFTSATQAREALLSLVCRADPPGSAAAEIRHSRGGRTYRLPVPLIEPQQRPAAMVLAIACRLAPLTPDESDAELRDLLALLPPPALQATARLAARVLPGAAEESDPVEAVVTGLAVLQLVGAHTREGT